MTKLSEHFSDWELISPNLLDAIRLTNVPPKWYVKQIYLDALEAIHDKFGKFMFINVNERMADRYGFDGPMYKRGICTDKECIDVGRKITTQHRTGAFDITILDVRPREIAEYVEQIKDEYRIGGMGIYEANNFVHIDWRNSIELIKWEY